MKLVRLIDESPASRILLLATAILFTLCVGPVYSASEPGTITIVLVAEPHNLDPSFSTQADIGQVLAKNVVEPLTEINPDDSSVTPRLATSWKQINPTTWQFVLRKGVKFHDGKDFNAKAVLFNITRLYDKRIENKTRQLFFSGIKMEGKALDSHTVELKTEKPEPLLPTLMGTLSMCSPNTPLDKLTRTPTGTGPYKLVKWDSGTQIVLEDFDGYWGKKGPVKKAIYVWRTESSVRASMVLIGEADIAPNIANQDATRPDMDYSFLNSETGVLHITVAEPPLNDRRVRMALNLAVDRDAIRGSILSKDVIPATHMIVPNIFGHNPALKVWPYDPKKAKQLLDEARRDGVPVDKEILLAGRIARYPGSAEEMEALMTMYKAVGLNVKLKMLEPGAYQPYNAKPFPKTPYLLQNSHDNSKGDAAFTGFTYWHCKGPKSRMCDAKVDELIERAQVSTGEERRSLWQAAFKRIQEEVIPDVMLFHLVGYARVGKRINFKPNMTTGSEIQLAKITFK